MTGYVVKLLPDEDAYNTMIATHRIIVHIFSDPNEPTVSAKSIIQTDDRDRRLDNSKICVKYLRLSYKVNSFSVLCIPAEAEIEVNSLPRTAKTITSKKK